MLLQEIVPQHSSQKKRKNASKANLLSKLFYFNFCSQIWELKPTPVTHIDATFSDEKKVLVTYKQK